MKPHGTRRTGVRVALIGGLFACLLGAFASPAHATHVLVEPGNLSAYQTINAALAAQSASLGAIETVYVAPGVYPETLAVHELYGATSALVGTADAAATSVLCAKVDGYTQTGYTIRGLRFLEPVFDAPPPIGPQQRPPVFRDCVFESGVSFSLYQGMWPHLFDCTFRGNTSLLQYAWNGLPPFSGLRFERCRLTIQSSTGPVYFRDCVFTGCADTAIVFRSLPENAIGFERCVIESAGVGFATTSNETALGLLDCELRDVNMGLDLQTPIARNLGTALTLTRTTFDRVGRAVRTTSPWALYVSHVRVSDCSGPAFEAMTPGAWITDVTVERAGAGLLLQGVKPTWPGSAQFFGATLDSCVMRDLRGDALRVSATNAATGRVRVDHSRITRGRGQGIDIHARGITIVNSLVADVGGDGLRVHQMSPATPDSVLQNTVVLAARNGIDLAADSGDVVSPALTMKNISVMNGRIGIALHGLSNGTTASNDSWRNGLADFTNIFNPFTRNLIEDPMFCDAAQGEFTLMQGSHCGGLFSPYGLIGAFPVACPDSPLDAGPRAPLLSLAVGPNPSLGGVRFALPAREEAGELEVLDLAGRRVWSQQVAPHSESLEWSGRTNGARASGVFFARYTQGKTRVTQRFVLLK